jgi:hypothetical protein
MTDDAHAIAHLRAQWVEAAAVEADTVTVSTAELGALLRTGETIARWVHAELAAGETVPGPWPWP